MQASFIIADDYPLILKGPSDFLKEKDYNLIRSAADSTEAIEMVEMVEMVEMQKPDIAGYCNFRHTNAFLNRSENRKKM